MIMILQVMDIATGGTAVAIVPGKDGCAVVVVVVVSAVVGAAGMAATECRIGVCRRTV